MSEKPANFKEKSGKYAIGVVGGIIGLGLLSVAISSLTSSPDAIKNDDVPTTHESQIDTSPHPKTALEKLQSERPTARDSTDAVQSSTEPKTKIETLLDPLAKERERVQLSEFRRASLAAQSEWGRQPIVLSNAAKESLPQPTVTTRSDDLRTSDDQRLALKQKLEELSALRERVLQGNYSIGDNPNVQNEQLMTLENAFSPAPKDIVGFTDENAYNASTDGMMKLPIGTIIPAVTIMKASSDRTGTFKAMVSQDIMDVSEDYVLIPKGAEVIIKSFRMSGANEAINSFVGMSVPWIVLPDGKKIDTSKSSGMDREGLTGISDQVDHHWVEQFLGVAAYALVANNTSYQGTGSNNDWDYASDVSQGVRDQIAPHAQKYLQLRPTNIIRQGQAMNVILEDEVYLMPWRNIYEDYL
ncbi:probable conjugal transfer protein TrbI [Vibrio mediterranei AK1]|jgi:type IV secretion system protein VirB10|uniref:TrbI/VirB10 family protein n=1 Tax=Vibrio mediterranei TaxID=689 RepID=UPI0001542A51|nr:TrbI/VirB10 family protein [Vibrio mediterranei]EDL52196.1 probable conjugal transfer protein TrbI [Vibrio mediterranei AK1]